MPNFLKSVLLALMLTGCANVNSDYALDASKTVGLAVGTITYDSSVGLYNVSAVPSGRAYKQEEGRIFKVGDSMWHPFIRMYDDDLKARGGTFAVELPAGEYVLKRWFINQGYITYAAKSDIGITFKVEPGKSVYLGNFHFDENSEVSLRDRAARDLPVLRKRFRAMEAAPLAFAISSDANFDKIGGEYSRRMDSPAFVPFALPAKK